MICPFSSCPCGLYACPLFVPAEPDRPSACAIRQMADSSSRIAKDLRYLVVLLISSRNS